METELPTEPKNPKAKFILPILSVMIFYWGLKAMDNFASSYSPPSESQTIIIDQQVAGARSDSFSVGNLALHPPSYPPIKTKTTIPPVNAGAYYALDVKTGYPLASHNADILKPFASTTKLMTAIIALENYRLDEVVTVSQKAALQIGSRIGLRTDEKITVHDLLRGLLISSGNDAAMALAEHMGLEEFLEKMNQKAEMLGMTSTTFLSPSGLDDDATSTAKDLAVLGAFSARFPEILNIAKTKEVTVFSVDRRISHRLSNSNRLVLGEHHLYLPYVQGLKTGFTPEAGHLLVTFSNKDGNQIVAVVMDAGPRGPEASARESSRLIRWVYDSFEWN